MITAARSKRPEPQRVADVAAVQYDRIVAGARWLARMIHGQDDRGAECAIITRSVSEANSVSRPRLRFGLRWGHA